MGDAVSEFEYKINIPSENIARNWLFAPSTYLIDSWIPYVEEVYLPSISTEGGDLEFSYQANGVAELSSVTKGALSKVKHFLKHWSDKPEHIKDRVILDLRDYSPGNLSHALMIHLPIALCAKKYLQTVGREVPLLIFPTTLPKHIYTIYREMDFDALLTDTAVVSNVCRFNVSSLVCLRGVLLSVIKEQLEHSEFAKNLRLRSKKLPNKIFISRKDTRCLVNESDVESLLTSYGYQKVYMEDYNIIDQLAMVSLADSIVAIHGAALGTLVFRGMFNLDKLTFIEIVSPGHMSNVYRRLVNQLNGQWVGVRGKLWPEIITQAYELPKEIHKFAYTDFEVCLLSLERALDTLGSSPSGV